MIDTAIILSAGLGTRLGPLTDAAPKVLLPVGGEPLLHRTIALLAGSGITRIGINVHHYGEMVRETTGGGSRWDVTVYYSEEHELLGSSGAVGNMADFIGGRRFAVLYGDVLMDLDVRELDAFHEHHEAMLSMALTIAEDPRRCGVVEHDSVGRLSRFVEKPNDAPPDAPVNAGVYVCEPGVLGWIPDGHSDFGREVIPAMLGAGEGLFGMKTNAFFQDIGTPEGYRIAEEAWAEGRLACRSL
ncbi:MAG: NDP-sugar synthase [Actinomycetota bacterium]|nr:nucleotidyltransferase family protein [Actinomycetota bacterium]